MHINNKHIWVWHSEHCDHELEQHVASSGFNWGLVGLSSADSAGTSCKLSGVNLKTLYLSSGFSTTQTNSNVRSLVQRHLKQKVLIQDCRESFQKISPKRHIFMLKWQSHDSCPAGAKEEVRWRYRAGWMGQQNFKLKLGRPLFLSCFQPTVDVGFFQPHQWKHFGQGWGKIMVLIT